MTGPSSSPCPTQPAKQVHTHLYVCMYVCLYVCMSFCLSVYLSICLSVYLSICLSVYLSICLSVYLSIIIINEKLLDNIKYNMYYKYMYVYPTEQLHSSWARMARIILKKLLFSNILIPIIKLSLFSS